MPKAKLSDAPLLSNDDFALTVGGIVYVIYKPHERPAYDSNVPHFRRHTVMSIDTRTRRARLRDEEAKRETVWTPGDHPVYLRRTLAVNALTDMITAYAEQYKAAIERDAVRHAERVQHYKTQLANKRARLKQILALTKCSPTPSGGTVRNVAEPDD